MEKIYNLAIIGGGPGGIASAVESQILGIKDVLLLEKGENHSTTIRKYYKDQKRVDKDYRGQKVEINGNIFFVDGTKETTLDLFDEILKTHAIDAEFNIEIESVSRSFDVPDVFEIHAAGRKILARFVVVAIGKMGKPNKPSYALPIALGSVINFNANDAKAGEKILVVGGGNSAVEYACALADTASVTLNYRRSEFSRINEVNAEGLKKALDAGRIAPRFGVDIEGVDVDESSGVKKPLVKFMDGEAAAFDRIIYAIGGASPVDFLRKCNLELDSDGVPVVSELHESSVKDLFVAGDIMFKSGGSIAIALNHGFALVKEIKKRLG